jgi:hypothetical protein
MSTKVKVMFGILAGATFMFIVFIAILGVMFFKQRHGNTINAPPVGRITGESITPSHFDLLTRLDIRSQPALEFRREPFAFTFWFRSTVTNRMLTFMAKRVHTLGNGWVISSLEDHSLLFYAAGCATTKAPAPNCRDGRWHHVAAVREETRLTLYLDGVVAGIGDNTCDFNDTYPIRIGMDAEPNGWRFEGDMAEVHFFNRALTVTEIAEEWNAGQPLKRNTVSEGLVAGYHLGTGATNMMDFSGNGADGTWVNVPVP